jgi:hypothetical protein
VKASLSGFILNDRRTARKLARILLDDKGRSLPADVALDVLIQEYVNLRLGGSSDIVSESKFPKREFTLDIPSIGCALIQRSKNLSHLEVTMPIWDEEAADA